MLKLSIEANNIGPLDSLKHEWSFPAPNRTVVYARNGSGKTFLSRMFRLDEDPGSCDARRLISFGKSSGSFEFKIDGPGGYSVSLAGVEPIAPDNRTGLRFHVFNSDYVADNVATSGYGAPDGIEGYIVGKGNLELEAEKGEVETAQAELSSLDKSINFAIGTVLGELRDANVNPRMGAYASITAENLLADALPTVENYSSQLASCKKLAELPENPCAIRLGPLVFAEGLTADIRRVLETPYSRSEFKEEFVRRIEEHRTFFQDGVSLAKENPSECPFCKRPVDVDAAALIADYEEYLDAAEAKARAEVESLTSMVEDLKARARHWGSESSNAVSSLKEACDLYPSLADMEVPRFLGPDNLMNACDPVYGELKLKLGRLDEAAPTDCLGPLEDALAELGTYQEAMNACIARYDEASGNIRGERTKRRQQLCEDARAKLRIDLDETIKKRRQAIVRLADAKRRLNEAQARVREPKRQRVASVFGGLVTGFFGDKYRFDPETFVISLRDHPLGSNAPFVLSEGEKTIIAFCYYLASTVERVDSVEDWDRLFFVIDDPISSLDYEYVYTMVGYIRDLKATLGVEDDMRERALILTHNYSFYNLLASNKVASGKLVLEDGSLRDANDAEIFPFEEHLSDIIGVAEHDEKVRHTTGNSIRHVVEWCWHIVRPSAANLREFFDFEPTLGADPGLYTLCNDLSHEHERETVPYLDSSIRGACCTLLKYMRDKFPGQVECATARFANSGQDSVAV